MIIGIGTDLSSITRISGVYARFGARFVRRILSPGEQAFFDERGASLSFLAKRFAAKEAFVKALGTGFQGGLSWQDIEIFNDKMGKPYFVVSGAAEVLVKSLLPQGYKAHFHLSLSDDKPFAQAFVLFEARLL